jgi:Fe-S-cluster containining protein
VKRKNPSSGPINERLAAQVKYNVLEMFGGEPIAARALEVARQVQSWADHLIDRYEAETPLPRPLACRPGCDFCCYNQIEATPLEVLAVWDYILALPSAEQTRLQDQASVSVRSRAGQSKAQIARSRRHFPCPFLHQGLCVIYPVRPLLCRAMHSLDAGHCQTSLGAERLLPDRYYLHRYEIVCSIIQGLTAGCREAGLAMSPADLARGVNLLFEQGEAGAARWLRGDAVFPASDPG